MREREQEGSLISFFVLQPVAIKPADSSWSNRVRRVSRAALERLLTYALHLRIAGEARWTRAAEGAGQVLANCAAAAGALVQTLVDVYNHILPFHVGSLLVVELLRVSFRFRFRFGPSRGESRRDERWVQGDRPHRKLVVNEEFVLVDNGLVLLLLLEEVLLAQSKQSLAVQQGELVFADQQVSGLLVRRRAEVNQFRLLRVIRRQRLLLVRMV